MVKFAKTVPVLALSVAMSQGPASVSRLGWMAGCWERRAGRTLIEEQWTTPRGGTMLGTGRTTRGDSLVEWEFVRMREDGAVLVYEAHPSGQPPAEFRSTALTDSSVVFANPEHDFPQRVMYRRAGADSLIARVEGVRNGRSRGADFPYSRTACPR